jgi:hypothetical protein
MSGLPPKGDKEQTSRYVRFVPIPDIASVLMLAEGLDHKTVAECRDQASGLAPRLSKSLRGRTCGRLGGSGGWWFWPRTGQRPLSYLRRSRGEPA